MGDKAAGSIEGVQGGLRELVREVYRVLESC
jgi:hypothetical protein